MFYPTFQSHKEARFFVWVIFLGFVAIFGIAIYAASNNIEKRKKERIIRDSTRWECVNPKTKETLEFYGHQIRRSFVSTPIEIEIRRNVIVTFDQDMRCTRYLPTIER